MSENEKLQRERETYQRVFSKIQIPEPVDVETIMKENRRETGMNFWQKHAAALGAALVIAGSTGVAYAADLGGIRTTVNVWLHGEHTQLDAVPNGTGGYEFYETGSDEPIGGGGGVWIDENGVEHAASAQEVAENLASPVEVREDGTVWLSVNDRTWDITDYIQSGKSENFHAGSRYFRVLVEGTGVQTQTSDRPEPGIAYIELD
ncbi:hypothetical protein [Faecalibaculum rodentium]|jgi:hypothetical protein|uniref:hypothetical protein n=1 Tax=Faecalibaculum rodentium TaxID=1702221 RepID=UPI00256E9B8F|nr:hypothetical protein [Faecalibaculum rodentium]